MFAYTASRYASEPPPHLHDQVLGRTEVILVRCPDRLHRGRHRTGAVLRWNQAEVLSEQASS